MKCLPLVLHVTLMLRSALLEPRNISCPALVNVFVDSHNFYNVLRWDPGPTTLSRIQYIINKRVNEKIEQILTNTTSLELLVDPYDRYDLTVQAFCGNESSPASKVSFTPYKDTKIGAAELSLAGCGNCIQINISLPKPDRRSEVQDLQGFYDPKFIIWWRKEKQATSNSKVSETHAKSFTLENLEAGEEYCVRVETEIRTNPNTLSSNWTCTFTSLVEVSRDSVVLGAVTTLLIIVGSVLMISMFCMYHTGFVGKLQATLPKGLMSSQSQGYTLTPEKTIPDLTSVISESEKQRIHNSLTSHAATRDTNSEEEEEEEEGKNYYLDRNAQLSSGESSYNSTSVSENCTPATSENSGRLNVSSSAQLEEPPAEFEFHIGVVQGGLDQDDCKDEDEAISFLPEEGQTEVQEHITGDQGENEVNLFSVTLAMMTASVIEEQNTRDTSKLYESEIPLATVSKLTLNNTDLQMTESDHRITVASAYPTHKDFTKTRCVGRHTHTEEDEDE